MTLQQYIQYALAEKRIEYHSNGGANTHYQCVDLVNDYIHRVWNLTPIISTNAKDFPTKLSPGMKFVKNTTEYLPLPGEIAVWNGKVGGGAGHVAIVTHRGSQLVFKSLDQNWSRRQLITLESHNYNNILGFIQKEESMPPVSGGGLPSNYPQIIHKSTQWDETVTQYGINKKPEQATVTDLVSRTSTEEKKSYDKGYRAGEKKVEEIMAGEVRRLKIYDEIVFPTGYIPGDMDEIDVFAALDRLFLEREQEKKEEKAETAVGESIKEPLRYVVGLVVGAAITYGYSQFPILGELGLEQQAITTSLIALIVRGLDKYVHTKDSDKGIDQVVSSLMTTATKKN